LVGVSFFIQWLDVGEKSGWINLMLISWVIVGNFQSHEVQPARSLNLLWFRNQVVWG